MTETDPIRAQRARRWDAIKAQSPDLPDDEITAQVMRELPDQPTELSLSEKLKGGARALASGATFGFEDEGEAAVRAALGQGDYKTLRDKIRAQNAQFAETYPKSNFALQLAGGAALPGLGTAGLAAKFGKGVLGSALGKMAAGGVVGATYGALQGAGDAPETEDVPGAAATGAMIGGAVGGVAAPLAGAIGSKVLSTRPVSKVVDKVGALAEQAGDKAATVEVPVLGQTAQKAGRTLNRAVNSDERAKRRALELVRSRVEASTSLADAQRAIDEAYQQFGVRLALPEISRNVSGLARAAANSIGASRDVIPEWAAQRAEMLPAEASDVVTKLTKTVDEPIEATIAKRNALAEQARDADYSKAYTHVVGRTPELTAVMSAPANTSDKSLFQKYYEHVLNGERRKVSAGASSPLYEAYVADPLYKLGERTPARDPWVAEIDLVKQALDTDIGALAEKRSRTPGDFTFQDRQSLQVLQATKAQLLRQAEEDLPKTATVAGEPASDYLAARSNAMAHLQGNDLLRDASNFRALSRSQLDDLAGRAALPGYPELARQGVAQGIREDLTGPRAMNQSPLPTMDRFARNFGGQRDNFMGRIYGADDNEAMKAYKRVTQGQTAAIRDMTQNSTTVRQAIDAIGAQAPEEVNALSAVAKGAKALKSGGLHALHFAGDALTRPGIDEGTSKYLSDYLTRTGPEAVDLLQLLNSTMADRLRQGSGVAGRGVVGGTASRLLSPSGY